MAIKGQFRVPATFPLERAYLIITRYTPLLTEQRRGRAQVLMINKQEQRMVMPDRRTRQQRCWRLRSLNIMSHQLLTIYRCFDVP